MHEAVIMLKLVSLSMDCNIHNISKGMVWSPNHGDTAFTVPLFDEFMKRIMPDDRWRD